MANRTYFLNTHFHTSDRSLINAALHRDGVEYLEVAEDVYRVPAPWLFCFQQKDLLPTSVAYVDDDGIESRKQVWIPCTTTVEAQTNLSNSLPLFEWLVGDEKLAFEYWQAALEAIKALPLPYLTMDIEELFWLNDDEELTGQMVDALGRTRNALPALRHFGGYTEGLPPFTLAEFYSATNDEETNPPDWQNRIDNCAALCCGAEMWWWHVRKMTSNGMEITIEKRE